MAGPNFPYTKLDYEQVIKQVYDEANDRLRTDATLNVGSATIQVSTSHVDDSIRLGDGTNLTTATVVGPKVGLDVNVLNALSLDVQLDAASDSVALGNQWKKLIDQASSTVTYIGSAIPNSSVSSAVWQIKRITTSGTLTLIEYANGNLNFNNIWNNRASLSYS